MVRTAKISVCVDSSIFLAEVFSNETHSTRAGAIDRYQKIFQFKKCMSETVKNEVENRMCKVTSLVEHASKAFMNFFSSEEKSTIELSDLSSIESFFSDYRTRFKSKKT